MVDAEVGMDLEAWDPWSPERLAERLAGLDVPWGVAGGWALDLFLGRQTRPHEDLEIAVPAHAFSAVAERFPDCAFYVPVAGKLRPRSRPCPPPPSRSRRGCPGPTRAR